MARTWRSAVSSVQGTPDLTIQFKHFLLEPKPTYEIKNKDSYHITFDSWIMPRSGFAWKLLEPGVSTMVSTADMVIPTGQPVASPDLLLNRSAQPPAASPTSGEHPAEAVS